MYQKKNYEDILHLPHHQSKTHPHMSISNRAAQFSPFAALTGYDARIRETARLTDSRADLTEEAKELINQKLLLIQEAKHPVITVTFFVSDSKCRKDIPLALYAPSSVVSSTSVPAKEGGSYLTVTGMVKRIDTDTKEIVFFEKSGTSEGSRIPLEDILALDFLENI